MCCEQTVFCSNLQSPEWFCSKISLISNLPTPPSRRKHQPGCSSRISSGQSRTSHLIRKIRVGNHIWKCLLVAVPPENFCPVSEENPRKRIRLTTSFSPQSRTLSNLKPLRTRKSLKFLLAVCVRVPSKLASINTQEGQQIILDQQILVALFLTKNAQQVLKGDIWLSFLGFILCCFCTHILRFSEHRPKLASSSLNPGLFSQNRRKFCSEILILS